MAVTNEHYELLMEVPTRNQCLETVCQMREDSDSASNTTSTHRKMDTHEELHTRGKQDAHEELHTRGKQDARGKVDTREKHDSRAKWDTRGQGDSSRAESSPSRYAGASPNARFVVGENREVLMGDRIKLAAVSPILRTTLGSPWPEDKDVHISDVSLKVFQWILRCADQKRLGQLNEHNVWDVLNVAERFQVETLLRTCFRFLLHRHPRRHCADHLCVVLETAHRLHLAEERSQCLNQVLQRGGQVLSSASAVAQLCRDCLLDIVRADHLQGADEVLVYRAVLMWAASQCRPDSGFEELRSVAGELVRHVRYLTLPGPSLAHLLEDPSPASELAEGLPSSTLLGSTPLCLLRKEEVDDLMFHEGSLFPPTVREKRRGATDAGCRKRDGQRGVKKKYVLWVSLILLILLFAFLLQYVLVRFLVAPLVHDESTSRPSERTNLSVADNSGIITEMDHDPKVRF